MGEGRKDGVKLIAPAAFVQRLPNVFQTPWMFGIRWVVVVNRRWFTGKGCYPSLCYNRQDNSEDQMNISLY